ncbi:replication restart DNA helicase PriA [Granulicella pectinivorans]|uniref:Replication restart protein PriA n=1 Tax=Granulicella pectinivorans TaxID=474950 RepID=A0A1I6M894_9BACT|nr:primosomal protein N' [Granulicella pectinivorans]SFS11828.1 replication restart DNA helicase PriA [Granulicella pectinivorans]
MALYCDVALPVPLDRLFTYACGLVQPVVGARVIVPFSGQRLMGVVARVHDDAPAEGIEVKPVQAVLDEAALVPDELMKLAGWIAQYYVAPLGEVLRGMLPLNAEVKRQFVYRIGEAGRRVLYDGAAKGASRRSKLTPEEQNREYAVLNYLEDGEAAKASALRSATQANKGLLDGMVKKKWLIREAAAEERDARRLERVAVLQGREQGTGNRDQEGGQVADPLSLIPALRLPKLNENQLAVMAELAAVGGRMQVRDLRDALKRLGVPESSLGTLVKRGLVGIEEVAQAFDMGGVHAAGKKFAHEHALNETQMEALGTIAVALERNKFAPHLLYGVTGSGKTAVYLAAMQRALAAGKSSLMLVPEIGLTPAMTGQMVAAFGGEVALLHSGLTPDERAEQWHRIRRGEAKIVVGTRSAVFAPVVGLGLVIVDEEHDSSYKQEETPRYHGRDVAVMRAKFNDAVVVLGSATPSLESWANAERGRYARVEMLNRVADRPLPAVELVDMRAEFQAVGKEEVFSRKLLEETQATLDRGEQAIILLNRRGYSFVVMCRSCGEKIECENCAISMTYHKPVEGSDGRAQTGQRLECHYCGFRRSVPKVCPKCESEHLYYMGAGSQQGEERLQELFPGARIGRMDRDTVRGRSDMERLLTRLHAGEINLLVGTQMIAKGHDIHGVTLVGVVGADFALGLPDFRAAERVFQLLTQVSGRAGRGDLPGKVVVQTYHPDHYAIQFAAKHDYPSFVAKEMNYRRWMHYPPYAVLANVVIQSDKLEEATGWSTALGRWFEKTTLKNVRVLGPAAAPIVRLKRIYRYHFVLKAEKRQVLGETLRAMLQFAEEKGIPRKGLVVDVDAVHLM